MATSSDGGIEATAGSRPEFPEGVTRLVRAHSGGLYRVARREGLREEDAYDCVQDAFHTFLQLPKARRLVESDEDSIKVLTVLVRNRARNRRRRHEIARPHDSGEETLALLADATPPADERVTRTQDRALVTDCLGHLGKQQREVVSLRLLDEIAGREVAARLGLRPSHVAVLLHRAKRNLRNCMVSAGYRAQGTRAAEKERAAVTPEPLET